MRQVDVYDLFVFNIVMLSIQNIVSRQLLKTSQYGFAGLPFGKKRNPTKSDLPKYDVVVAGGNLGAVFSTHFDKVVGEKASMLISYESPLMELHGNRTLFELGHLDKTKFIISTSEAVPKPIGRAECIPVDSYQPEKNQVTLKNGRTIEYDNLVVATGQKHTYTQIKGFDEAWADFSYPFYCGGEHPAWSKTATKAQRWIFNFNGGEALYYIPPGNCHGPTESLNFLAAKNFWDRQAQLGKFNWGSSKLTVITGNDSIAPQFPELDELVRDRAMKMGIDIESGYQLVEVRKDEQVAVFKNLATGETIEKFFNNFYSLLPTEPHSNLSDAGLADSTGYLDVDRETLQHKKYPNIFGVGDCLNVPTTKTFYGGLRQVAVARHNVERNLKGLSLNAKYDGFSQSPLYTGFTSMNWVSQAYDQPLQIHWSQRSANMNFRLHRMFGKGELAKIYKGKSWGPPNYKTKLSFKEEKEKQAEEAVDLHPAKKVA